MKKFSIYMSLLVLLTGVLTGCSAEKRDDSKESKYHLYYLNAEETELIQEAYVPANEQTQDMIQELMAFLKEDSSEEGNLPLLPGEVEVGTYSIQEKTLTIDFNKAYHNMDLTREVLTRAGVVKLFAQIPEISYVKISVDGEEIKDDKGQPFSVMNEDSFVEYSGGDINSYQYATITLYFTNKEGTVLIPEERTVYYNSNIPLERVVVEQLMKGPTEQGLYRTLPNNITILAVTTDDENCYLNLDSVFISDALPIQENIPIYSIVNSVVEACQVSNIQISINGETNVVFRESMKLDQFYKSDTSLVQE